MVMRRPSRSEWRSRAALALVLAVVNVTATAGLGPATSRPHASKRPAAPGAGGLPVAFEPNVGQAPADVRFVGGGASLTATGAVLAGGRVTLSFAGASGSAQIAGAGRLAGRANYLVGDDPARWKTNVPTYSAVRYDDLYPGVDLVWYGRGSALEYDLVVAPGADPSAVSFELRGAPAPEVDADGALVAGGLRFGRPVAYQEIGGERRAVASRYALLEGGCVGLRLGDYDRRFPLVVDPEVGYSYPVADAGRDISLFGLAVDATGASYVVGSVKTANDSGAFAGDVFVAKLNPEGTALVYSTTIGGSNTDTARDVAVDAAGNAYVTGETESNDFPATAGAFQTTRGSSNSTPDAFVVKVGPAGDAVVYASYLGGAATDLGNGVAVDQAGNAYLTGTTSSTNFPVAAASQATSGGSFDAFLTKVNPAGSARVYSTYLGGSESDGAAEIALDAAGSVYLTGGTFSTNFPVTAGAFQSSLAGASDGFWTKLDVSGQRTASTYLGGSGDDNIGALAVDASGRSYLTGASNSADFPLVAAVQTTIAGNFDAVVVVLDATGAGLDLSTFYGGSQYDTGAAVDVDEAGLVYVTGDTFSADFPTVDPVQSAFGGGVSDLFVLRLDPGAAGAGGRGGAVVGYSSFLGTARAEFNFGAGLDQSGSLLVGGYRPDLSPNGSENEEGEVSQVTFEPLVLADLELSQFTSFASVVGDDDVLTIVLTVSVTSRDTCGGPAAPNARFGVHIPEGLRVAGFRGDPGVSLPELAEFGTFTFEYNDTVPFGRTVSGTIILTFGDDVPNRAFQLRAFAGVTGALECSYTNNDREADLNPATEEFVPGTRVLEFGVPKDGPAIPVAFLVANAPPLGARVSPANKTADVRAFNVYTSTQPNVQPVGANLLTSVPPHQTAVDVTTTPAGSFFVVTAVTDSGESPPSNEVGGELPVVTKLKVSASKIAATGTGFASDVRVIFGGLPFSTAPKLKRNNTKLTQKGPLVTGQSIGDVLNGFVTPGSTVTVLFVNGNGNGVAVEYTR